MPKSYSSQENHQEAPEDYDFDESKWGYYECMGLAGVLAAAYLAGFTIPGAGTQIPTSLLKFVFPGLSIGMQHLAGGVLMHCLGFPGIRSSVFESPRDSILKGSCLSSHSVFICNS